MIFNRPWPVVFPFVSGLLLAVFAWVRFGMALSLWDYLSSLPLAVSPLYLALTGLGWGVAGLMVAEWTWRGNPRAPLALRILSVTYALYYWADQLWIMTSDIRQSNWIFIASLTVVAVLGIFLSLRPAAVRAFFGEKNDR